MKIFSNNINLSSLWGLLLLGFSCMTFLLDTVENISIFYTPFQFNFIRKIFILLSITCLFSVSLILLLRIAIARRIAIGIMTLYALMLFLSIFTGEHIFQNLTEITPIYIKESWISAIGVVVILLGIPIGSLLLLFNPLFLQHFNRHKLSKHPIHNDTILDNDELQLKLPHLPTDIQLTKLSIAQTFSFILLFFIVGFTLILCDIRKLDYNLEFRLSIVLLGFLSILSYGLYTHKKWSKIIGRFLFSFFLLAATGLLIAYGAFLQEIIHSHSIFIEQRITEAIIMLGIFITALAGFLLFTNSSLTQNAPK